MQPKHESVRLTRLWLQNCRVNAMVRICILVLLVILLRVLDARDEVVDSDFGSRQHWKRKARRISYGDLVGAIYSSLQL